MACPALLRRESPFVMCAVTSRSLTRPMPPMGATKRIDRTMSTKAAQHHKNPADHHTQAASHHTEAAKHHESGNHEKAAHHAHTASGHAHHATHHGEEAGKAHMEEHGKK